MLSRSCLITAYTLIRSSLGWHWHCSYEHLKTFEKIYRWLGTWSRSTPSYTCARWLARWLVSWHSRSVDARASGWPKQHSVAAVLSCDYIAHRWLICIKSNLNFKLFSSADGRSHACGFMFLTRCVSFTLNLRDTLVAAFLRFVLVTCNFTWDLNWKTWNLNLRASLQLHSDSTSVMFV